MREEQVQQGDEETGRGGGGFDDEFRRRRALRSRRTRVAAALLLAALAAGGGWLWLRSRAGSGASVQGPQNSAVVSPPAPAEASGIALPDLDASDEFVRQMAASLSSHPGWVTWLASDRLIRRFVRAVVAVSTGQSPADQVKFLRPEGRFRVRRSGGLLVASPASYRRYDLAAAIFASLDTPGTAEAYRRLHPLFQKAYRDLGFAHGSFDGALALAIENLLAVHVPEGPVALERAKSTYVYRDPALEGLSAAQKQLLLMGPENARRVQAKFRELAGALGLGGSGSGGQVP